MKTTNPDAKACVIVAALVLAANAVGAVELCTSCSDCEAKLASGMYATVQLDTDIIDHAGTCIDLDSGESNLTFDCAGHFIDSDGLSASPVRGVAMYHGSGNTVTNCVITDFTSAVYLVETTDIEVSGNVMLANNIGIDLANASGTHVVGNTVQNSFTGLKLSSSDDSFVEWNTFCDNFPWDIYFASGIDNIGDDNVCSVAYYWNDIGVDDCTFTCAVFESGFEDGGFGDWIVVNE
jgi:parallel beta-helix repeat protein